MAIRLFLFSMLLISLSCSASSPETEGQQQESPGINPTDSLPFAVAEKFSDLEPLFHLRNDTTYVINFWATWCKPCVAELPWFEQLHQEMTGQPVKVVLVSMDFPKQFESKLLPFVQERQLKATVIALADMDYNSWIDKVSTEWDGAIPFTLIYKNDHRQIKLGELDSYEELKEQVREVRAK